MPMRFTDIAAAFCLGAALALAPMGIWAQTQEAAPADETAGETIAPLLDLLGMDDLAPILRREGMGYAEDLRGDLFPGRGGTRWEEMIDDIYDTRRMTAVMAQEMGARLPAEHLPALSAFFGSELGGRIVLLEITAREAMLEESVDSAARAALAELEEQEHPRLALIDAFIAANDLVEMNVAGALNSNLAFYKGLSAGGAFNGVMTEDEMLADVWSQEDDVRAETETWVRSYLALAYRPLEDEEVQAYIALSETPAGQALNTALFASFDALFTTISHDLGRAAAAFMAGEDI